MGARTKAPWIKALSKKAPRIKAPRIKAPRIKAPTDKSPGGQKPQADKSPKGHMLRTVESDPGTKFRGRLVASKTFAGINFRGPFAEKNSWV